MFLLISLALTSAQTNSSQGHTSHPFFQSSSELAGYILILLPRSFWPLLCLSPVQLKPAPTSLPVLLISP
jgi:hypothetical protein